MSTLGKMVIASVLVGAGMFSAMAEDAGWYVFTSFRGNGEDGLHLALSRDGYKWQALNGDKPFLKPTVGRKIMRDPAIAQGPDGVFRLVWTSGWTAQEGGLIGYSTSTNLINWTKPQGIHVMQNEPKTRNVWAPELCYDEKNHEWIIFWSSTVTGKFPDETGVSEDKYNHRAYCTTTKDFKTFSESRLFFDPGFNMIDGSIVKNGDEYLLVFKDERLTPPQKNLHLATSKSAAGPFENVSDAFTISWVEGPSLLKIGDTWFCYFDHYASPHYYGAVRSKDLKHWEDCSKEMKFPADYRHGTAIKVSETIGKALLEQSQKNEQKEKK